MIIHSHGAKIKRKITIHPVPLPLAGIWDGCSFGGYRQQMKSRKMALCAVLQRRHAFYPPRNGLL